MYFELKKYRIQYMSVFVATLIYASDGIHEGWVSPAVQQITNNASTSTLPLTPADTEWISQMQIMGKMCGVPLTLALYRHTSRKLAILLSPLPLVISWLAVLFAPTADLLLLGKLIGGMADPATTICLTIYIGEVAHPDIRGFLGMGASLIYNGCILFSYVCTPLVTLKQSALIGLLFVVVQMFLVLFILESPYYLLSLGKVGEARKHLQMLTPESKAVDVELARMTTMMQQQLEQRSQFMKLFTDATNRKALLIALLTLIAQPMGGMSVMTFNCHLIFSRIGNAVFSQYSAILYQTISVVSCVVAVVVLMRYNTRALLLWSCFTCAASLLVQGGLFYAQDYAAVTSWAHTLIPYLLLANVLAHVVVFKVGLGSIPNILLSEVFAINVKVSGCALGTFAYALSFLLMNAIFNQTKDRVGMWAPFWILGCLTMVGGVLCYMFVPDTKGKSLEQIQEELARRDKS